MTRFRGRLPNTPLTVSPTWPAATDAAVAPIWLFVCVGRRVSTAFRSALRIVPIQARRLDQVHDGGRALSAEQRARKHDGQHRMAALVSHET